MPGSLIFFGQTSNNKTLACEQASLTVSLQAATFNVKMPADQASLTLSFQQVTLRKGITMAAQQASLTISLQAATFDVKMPAAQASLTVALQAATFKVTMPAAQASLSLALQAATFGIKIPADQASLSLALQAATFNVTMPAEQDSIPLSFQDVTLTYTPVENPVEPIILTPTWPDVMFKIVMDNRDPLDVPVQFQAATLRATRKMTADQASASINLQAATFAISMPVSILTSLSIKPQDATLKATRKMAADQASLTLAWQTVELFKTLRKWSLACDLATLTLDWQSVDLKASYRLYADHKGLNFIPGSVQFRAIRTMPADGTTLTVSPQDATFNVRIRITETLVMAMILYGADLVPQYIQTPVPGDPVFSTAWRGGFR